MNKELGFSLIELMVVVAIIALLAVVVVPRYENYMVKTRLSGVLTNLYNLSDQYIMFRNTNGYFPDPNADLGVYSFPYVDYIYGGDDYGSYGPPCRGAIGEILAQVSPANVDWAEGNYWINIYIETININGVNQRQCFMQTSSTDGIPPDFLQNCVNLAETGWDPWYAYLASATCE